MSFVHIFDWFFFANCLIWFGWLCEWMNRVDLEKHAKEATQKEESTDEKNIINNNGLKLDEDKSIIEET